MIVLSPLIGPVWSNAPLDPAYALLNGDYAGKHTCLDLGTEEYTTGKPHPMIDPAIRAELLINQANNPDVGVILLDFVLGYGSHPDPAGAMRDAIHRAKQNNPDLVIVASVTGTQTDPQSRQSQIQTLEDEGVIVAPSNAAAARAVARCVGGTHD